MLHNVLARFRAVRVRITIVATVLTGVALTLSAVLLVSAVQHRLKSQVRADTEQAAADVAFALQAGQPFDRAVAAPRPGTLVYIVSRTGDSGRAGGTPSATCRRRPTPRRQHAQRGLPLEVTSSSFHRRRRSGRRRLTLADVQRSVSELSRCCGWAFRSSSCSSVCWPGCSWSSVEAGRLDAARVDEISETTLTAESPSRRRATRWLALRTR
jgi:hypothetical protein